MDDNFNVRTVVRIWVSYDVREGTESEKQLKKLRDKVEAVITKKYPLRLLARADSLERVKEIKGSITGVKDYYQEDYDNYGMSVYKESDNENGRQGRGRSKEQEEQKPKEIYGIQIETESEGTPIIDLWLKLMARYIPNGNLDYETVIKNKDGEIEYYTNNKVLVDKYAIDLLNVCNSSSGSVVRDMYELIAELDTEQEVLDGEVLDVLEELYYLGVKDIEEVEENELVYILQRMLGTGQKHLGSLFEMFENSVWSDILAIKKWEYRSEGYWYNA